MSQGRKKNVARLGLEPRVSQLPCEHSTTELPSHTIDQLHFPPAYSHIRPRICSEPCRNRRDSLRLLLAARARTHSEPPNVTGVEKERGPTGTQTQGLDLAYRANTLPLSSRGTRSIGYRRKKNVARPGRRKKVTGKKVTEIKSQKKITGKKSRKYSHGKKATGKKVTGKKSRK